MLNTTKSHKWNKILPAFDLALLLILAMFSLQGFTKLEVDPPPLNVSAQKEKETEGRLAQAKSENESILREYEKTAAEASSLERRAKESGDIHPSPVQAPIDLEALREKVQRLRQEVHRRQMELEFLNSRKKMLEEGERQFRSLQDERQKLAEKHGQIEEQNRALSEEIAKAQRTFSQPAARVIQVEGTPLMSSTTERRPVYVALVNGTISPVQEPFYTRKYKVVELGKGGFAAVDLATRQRNGETLEQALARDSVFSRLIRNIHPDHQYVALLVDSSSFESFRAIRIALRDRKIPFGWEPLSSLTIQFSPSGQIIPEET